MLRNRNIAFFIDVDNVDLTNENFDNIIAQLDGMGEILYGKVYGAKERKHKAIYDQSEVKGYKVERPMRMKRRGRRDFDSRIFVDVVDAVCHAPSIDAVCVITASCDLVYLYSYLHGKGIKVISSDENEAASNELVDEYVDLGRVYEIPIPVVVKPAPKRAVKPVTRPAVATATRSVARAVSKTKTTAVAQEDQPKRKEDNTDELLKEIERLRRVAEEQKAEKEAKSKAAEEARAKAETEARARAEEREKAKKAIEEAKAKAREEAETKAREEERQKAQKAIEEAKAKVREEAREEAAAKEREEARLKAIEEAKAKAREEARAEERERAQKEIEEARRRAQEAAEKARQEEEARAKAEEEIRLKLAELARSGGNNDELMRELEKLKHLTSETNQLVKEMKDEPKEKEIVVVRDTDKEDKDSNAIENARMQAQRVIEEAQAKARAEALAREEAEAKVKAHQEETVRARAEEREKAKKEIEEVKARAREEAEARAREEERLKAQKEIEEAKVKARAEAEAKAREEERLKAQKEIEHWRSIAEAAEVQPEEQQQPDSPSARYYIPRTDSKLIRKIEEISSGSDKDENDELLATIKNLLDGLD